ncbi:endonuclease/exonuclease/phosphatase family protein [Nocardiopsis sp. HNM0947]|uniref:Endonuclease/exonuclease/phosphatase family protein n=1 Tax=Nocardiopsis coralli TaxID=2772213 RepID=A0ABR9P202_9ACTN|nr:endonuclease/exonuclease/phosphatase family protein [Nocardiopsis coralli]
MSAQWSRTVGCAFARCGLVTSGHPVPPVAPSGIERWTYETASLPEADDGGPLRIVAGDFNATLDHAALRDLLASGYVDAAAETGNGLEPTWPNGRPSPPLTIDHVLVDGTASVDATSVHDAPGSDHRAVLATLTLPAG